MTYQFIILVFLIYVIPFKSLAKLYSVDKDRFKLAKVLNILITLVMVWYIVGAGNTVIEIISDFKGFKNIYHIEAGVINADLNLITKIIHNCINFFMIIVVFQLTRRNERYRSIFIYLLPILLLSMTLEMNRDFYRVKNIERSEFVLLFVFIWSSVKCVALFLIYNSKVFKNLICFNNERIKEIALKKG